MMKGGQDSDIGPVHIRADNFLTGSCLTNFNLVTTLHRPPFMVGHLWPRRGLSELRPPFIPPLRRVPAHPQPLNTSPSFVP